MEYREEIKKSFQVEGLSVNITKKIKQDYLTASHSLVRTNPSRIYLNPSRPFLLVPETKLSS